MRWYRLSLSLSFLLCVPLGCSAVVSPDEGRLGGDGGTGTDTGAPDDTGPPIILMDGGGDSMTTSPPPDTSVIDTAPGCSESDDRCEGEIAVECIDGMVETTDCASMMAYCESAECRDWECTPGATRCDGDASRSVVCDARGTDETVMDCPFGCDPSTGMCNTMAPVCPGIPPLAAGAAVMVSTCGRGDDTTHDPTPDGMGCPTTQRANGGDLIYAITLTRASTITLDLRDDEEGVAIDTVVYLRTDCEDRESQVACSDDLPCGATDFGCSGSGGGTEVRQSRITVTLEPGTYYVVVDTFNYSTSRTRYTCGDVLLRYNVLSSTP